MSENEPMSSAQSDSIVCSDNTNEPNPDYINRDDYVGSHTGDEVEDLKNS
tara:strand:- start:53583 stop:53732 length:150 start_codon:yes stop_codon:yes gene_type:complete